MYYVVRNTDNHVVYSSDIYAICNDWLEHNVPKEERYTVYNILGTQALLNRIM